jgi:prolipoprotein diacylglyceryltransferase
VWLIVLLVDRLDTGSRHVLDGGLAIVGCFAGIFIVATLYIRATLR